MDRAGHPSIRDGSAAGAGQVTGTAQPVCELPGWDSPP